MTAPATEKAAPIPALLPCPFCGSSGDELMLFCDPDEGHDNSGPSRRIQCAGCNVEAPYYPTKAEAVKAWNSRADRASQEERIREDERVEFNRGYLIAVTNVMNMHKDAVVAAELLMQIDVTIDDADALDLTDYDMDALKRLRSEPRAAAFFKRKRRARLRGAAS